MSPEALSNIDRSGRVARLVGGIVSLLVGVGVSIYLIRDGWEWPYRALAAPAYFAGFLCLFQSAGST